MNTQAAAAAPLLRISHISKRFGSLLANDDISLTLQKGEILALLGENGAGKTTLMNILFGHYAADSGHIEAFGEQLPPESTDAALAAGIGMVHQHFTLADNMTVLENIMLGTESLFSLWSQKRRAQQRIAEIAAQLGLEINLDIRVGDLSVGERQRVEIIKVLYRDAKILILDEPTAVLTPQEVDSLFAILRQMVDNGLSIIIISHKLHEVLAISQRVVVLRHGVVVGEAATVDCDRDSLAEMIVGRQIERPVVEQLERGDSVLRISGLSLAGQRGARPLLDTVDLNIFQHEIIGLAGVSGNGQRELAEILSGERAASGGQIEVCGTPLSHPDPRQLTQLGTARIPEDRHAAGAIGDMSIWENLLLEDLRRAPCWNSGILIDNAACRARANELVEQFDIRCAGIDMPAKLLSGGNLQKVILARNFLLDPRFVLANQPARGLDEGAIAFVHEKLLDAKRRGSGVLLITEDLDELLRLSDRIVVIHEGKLSESYPAATLTPRMLGVLMTGGTLDEPTAQVEAVH